MATRGAACDAEHPCATGLDCLTGHTAFGGYCASACGASCDGACVGTPRGELCMAACTTDADCRASEGYVCDRAWRACVMPNSTAIVPRTCPAPRGIGRDPAFAPTTALAVSNASAAVVRADGALIVAHAKGVTLVDPQGRPPVTTAIAIGAQPALARDARGVYATWQADGVMFASSKDGVAWSAATKLDDCTTCRATIVASAAAIHVVIASEGIRVRTSRDGGKTFGAAVTASVGGAANAALGADGRLHLAALDGNALGGYGSANHRVLYATAGRTVTVSRRDEMLPFHFATPAIALDARRRWIYIAYVRGGRDAIWDLVVVASKDGGATWTRTRIGDDPPCAIHAMPALAVDSVTGTLHVAWYDSRAGRFAHATCGAGLAKCTQVGRIDDTPFGALSAIPGRIGDASLVLDDKRRALHAIWTRPSDGQLLHAKAKLLLR